MKKDVIIEELWNIFSYYSLHADPIQPETIKISTFMKFVKDCQIFPDVITTNSTAQLLNDPILSIEMSILKMIRSKQKIGNSNGKGNNERIAFSGFISIIESLASVVYIGQGKLESSDCVRRLLLENILLMSNRLSKIDHNREGAISDVSLYMYT